MAAPSTENLTLHHYGAKPDLDVAVVYTPTAHWRTGDWRAYDVTVDGADVGRIEQALESTDRQAGRIRIPGRGRLAWAWHREDGTRNAPGLYARTRREAVAELLGYSSATKRTAR